MWTQRPNWHPQLDGISAFGTWTECQRSMMVQLLTFPWDGAIWQWHFKFSDSKSHFQNHYLRLMVLSGREGRRKGHTCGTWSRSRGVQERCFWCIKACFWGHHCVSLDMWTLCTFKCDRSGSKRRFPRIFAVKKTTPRLTKYTMDQCAGEWSSCEGFFSSIFCGRGCKGSWHQCVATRGLRGTAR